MKNNLILADLPLPPPEEFINIYIRGEFEPAAISFCLAIAACVAIKALMGFK